MAQQARQRGAREAHVQLDEPRERGRALDADRRLVAPADASGQVAHGGGPVVVDDEYDTEIKIGEALEMAARAVGDQPVRGSDAAAIRAAEARAGVAAAAAVPGGVAEQAQAAADSNAGGSPGEAKVTIADVLRWNATAMLSTEKAVTEDDTAAVAEAAANEPGPGGGAATRAHGVSAALAAAAKHNREDAECQSKRSTQPRAADERTAALAEQFGKI
ncbi:late embryogenesis abundant protein 47-like [Oryza brachyantha]|uniref:late embryogenesis abundant protein 47-like n=1 Tax=Oryza brachyantha TaxID=4533 RepID=UPI001ADD1463|nr:late embryogenesis abundant protein 47-like [Oryza brachyantha]